MYLYINVSKRNKTYHFTFLTPRCTKVLSNCRNAYIIGKKKLREIIFLLQSSSELIIYTRVKY